MREERDGGVREGGREKRKDKMETTRTEYMELGSELNENALP